MPHLLLLVLLAAGLYFAHVPRTADLGCMTDMDCELLADDDGLAILTDI